MVDAFQTQVELTFKVPKGETDRINRVIKSALSPSIMGKAKGMGALMGGGGGLPLPGPMGKAKGMGALMGGGGGLPLPGPLMAAGAAAGAIVMSSPSLQKTLKQLMKTVMLLIRPVGDIIAIGLRPIIDILRPIGIFFRILIRPYLQKAMEAMRLGRGFLAQGELGKAAESYALGAGFLLKPFFDMMVTIITIEVQGILAGIKVLGQALISLVPFTEDVSVAFGETMDSMILNVGVGGATIIRDTELMMVDWLTSLKTEYANMEKETDTHMETMSTLAGEGFIRMIEGATDFFITTESVSLLIEDAFDGIVAYGEEKIAELNALLEKETKKSSSITDNSQKLFTSSNELINLIKKYPDVPIWKFGSSPDVLEKHVNIIENMYDFEVRGSLVDLDKIAEALSEATGLEIRAK